jgi:NAD(P)-dependent dehydrogenase (short-subunit alcohol dehydrogenase family)
MSQEALGTMPSEEAERMGNALVSMIPVGRFGNPVEIEGVIQLLASDAGSYITGSNMVADGGCSIMTMPDLRN